MKILNQQEILSFLKGIESGSILLTSTNEPQSIYAGNVMYNASNGWKITIFNDANEWDYIDEIITSDGRSIEFSQLENMPLIVNYYPPDEVIWKAYGIPGCCKFRCKSCGEEFKYQKDNVFLCDNCKNAL